MNDFPRASQEVVVVTDQRTEPRPCFVVIVFDVATAASDVFA
jgi:hypothetical protein